MKKITLLIVVLSLLTGYSSASDKIGFVDLEQVFNEFYKTKQAKSRIEAQQQDIRDEQKVMEDEIITLSNAADTLKKEARDSVLTEEIRDSKRLLYEERLLELRAKQKEVEAFVSRRQQQLQTQSVRMSELIREEIRHTIVEYATGEGYLAVLEDSSRRPTGLGGVIYTHPSIEITEPVLNILNSKCPDLQKEGGLFDKEKKTAPNPEKPVHKS